MSDTIVRIISVNEKFQPNEDQIESSIKLLKRHLHEDELRIMLMDNIEFIDQGSNFEEVKCPICSKALDMEWWQAGMEEAMQSDFQEISVSLPCCRIISSLNKLDYYWPAGFARFVLELRNPDNIDIIQTHLKELQELMDTELKIIIAQY